MNTFIKISKIIFNIITTIIIVVGILFVGLFCFGIQPYVVESGSMEPTIETGSVCFVNRHAKYEDMKVGDIIAFQLDEGAFATHRIKEITDEGFTTKGDKNKADDNIITTRSNFIGKNIFSIPKVGFIVKGIQEPKGKIILGTIIVVLIMAAILTGTPNKEKKKIKS